MKRTDRLSGSIESSSSNSNIYRGVWLSTGRLKIMNIIDILLEDEGCRDIHPGIGAFGGLQRNYPRCRRCGCERSHCGLAAFITKQAAPSGRRPEIDPRARRRGKTSGGGKRSPLELRDGGARVRERAPLSASHGPTEGEIKGRRRAGVCGFITVATGQNGHSERNYSSQTASPLTQLQVFRTAD
ncbi:hypothetical protein EYF80_050225 [Liparis tanakae]|uniref:Uncharacterized protein n=1 Tax=Liparis tanakae TaxID=230148 RepID=A0A4Z2FEH7_9TELE|nr:hypothetical protein EYF80_050225 [Liparis tanakae]